MSRMSPKKSGLNDGARYTRTVGGQGGHDSGVAPK